MAQTGFTPIALYYSSTASAVPTAGNLVNGELALNNNDGKLFYKDSAGVVQVIAGKGGAGVAGGSNTQVQYNSSGSLAGSANMVFDGSTLTTLNSAYTGTLTGGTGVVNLGSGQFYKDASGNVGIGTSSPSCKLDVNRGSAGLLANFTDGVNTNFQIETSSLLATIGPSAGSTAMAFKTGNTERMRIDSSGNLLVGLTATLNDGKVVSRTPSGSTGYGFRSDAVNAAGTTFGHFYGTSSTNSVANIIIFGNGNIVNANNSYGAISDIKNKENIVDATPKLNKLLQVKVRNYNLKGDYEQHKQIGVVAQELEEVFPSLVEETIDRDVDGKDAGTTTKSVKYSVFVPMLIKAIQEQQALIESLTTRLTVLEAK